MDWFTITFYGAMGAAVVSIFAGSWTILRK